MEKIEVTKDAKTGNAAMRFYAEKDSLYTVQTLSNLISGESYTLTAQLNHAKGNGAAIKIEFSDATGATMTSREVYKPFREVGNVWIEVS